MKIDWIFMFALKEHEQIYTHTINGIRTETSTNFALSRKYRFFFLFFFFLSHFLSCNHFLFVFFKDFFHGLFCLFLFVLFCLCWYCCYCCLCTRVFFFSFFFFLLFCRL